MASFFGDVGNGCHVSSCVPAGQGPWNRENSLFSRRFGRQRCRAVPGGVMSFRLRKLPLGICCPIQGKSPGMAIPDRSGRGWRAGNPWISRWEKRWILGAIPKSSPSEGGASLCCSEEIFSLIFSTNPKFFAQLRWSLSTSACPGAGDEFPTLGMNSQPWE